ncbi:MAG: DUF1559 domain-containing protein [Akkermansiaceae bacterium]|nr:DUF1559 domain-containing protein [Armatimonadota bacterium]
MSYQSDISPMRRARVCAFTLIELLVVIVIIALLAAILFPVFAQARSKARQVACASNMRQLGMGVLQYTPDYDETFPVHDPTYPLFYSAEWQMAIYPYVKSKPIYRCPDDPQPELDPAEPRISGVTGDKRTPVSYLYNPLLGSDYLNSTNEVRTESMVRQPAKMILFMEGYSETANVSATMTGPINRGLDMDGKKSIWLNPFVIRYNSSDYQTGGTTGCKKLPRHGGNQGGNFTFVDGHVKFYVYRGGVKKLQQVLPLIDQFTTEDMKYVNPNSEPEWFDTYEDTLCL